VVRVPLENHRRYLIDHKRFQAVECLLGSKTLFAEFGDESEVSVRSEVFGRFQHFGSP
jgi:hypothetical protein